MSKKFVAVLNKSSEIELSRLMNALGHMTAGLAGNTEQRDEMQFVSYEDANGGVYPNISECPFIILRGTGGKIKTFRSDLAERGIPYSCFLDTMVQGGSDVQRENTSKKSADELLMYGLVTFGEAAVLDTLTKKFSLWR